MVLKLDEQPISIGGFGGFAALGSLVGAGSAEQSTHRKAARPSGGARRAPVALGARLLVAVFILRRSVAHERRHGWKKSDRRTSLSPISRGLRASGARRIALVRLVRARALLEARERTRTI